MSGCCLSEVEDWAWEQELGSRERGRLVDWSRDKRKAGACKETLVLDSVVLGRKGFGDSRQTLFMQATVC